MNSKQNGSDKINPISENPTKIKVSFDFTESLTSNNGNLGALVHIYMYMYFRKQLACALNRANTVY